MADETPRSSINVSTSDSAPPAPPVLNNTQSGPTINIADEFGTAKRNLPPAATVLITLVGVLLVIAAISFLQRAKPQASGSLDNISAAEVAGQTTTLAALTFTMRNSSSKIFWVRNVQGKLKTTSGELEGEALSGVDFDRYFKAFPALKAGVQPPLSPEARLQPGEEIRRTVIVSFPVTIDAFNQRQSVSVIVDPYDQPLPVVMTK